MNEGDLQRTRGVYRRVCSCPAPIETPQRRRPQEFPVKGTRGTPEVLRCHEHQSNERARPSLRCAGDDAQLERDRGDRAGAGWQGGQEAPGECDTCLRQAGSRRRERQLRVSSVQLLFELFPAHAKVAQVLSDDELRHGIDVALERERAVQVISCPMLMATLGPYALATDVVEEPAIAP